jgi:hypothetical protein
MRTVLRVLAVTATAALLASCGITGNFRHDPGYADFDSPGLLDTDREIGLSLGPLPLAMARLFVGDDPDLGPLMKDLRAARVYVYDVVGDPEHVAQSIATTQSELMVDGWLPIVTIREDGERVAVLAHDDSRGKLRGLAVIVQDSEDVVLVNLIGNIHLESFNVYMAGLDVDAPRVDIDPATLHANVY